jgi:hypothetical protein
MPLYIWHPIRDLFKIWHPEHEFLRIEDSPLFLSSTSCEMTLLPSSSSFGRLQAMVVGHNKSARVSFGQASRAPTRRAPARKSSSCCCELRPGELPRVSSGRASRAPTRCGRAPSRRERAPDLARASSSAGPWSLVRPTTMAEVECDQG